MNRPDGRALFDDVLCVTYNDYEALRVQCAAVNRPNTKTAISQGDDESLRERAKFNPRHTKTPLPMVAKICADNYVGDTYHRAKFCPNRFRSSFLRMRDFAPLGTK